MPDLNQISGITLEGERFVGGWHACFGDGNYLADIVRKITLYIIIVALFLGRYTVMFIHQSSIIKAEINKP